MDLPMVLALAITNGNPGHFQHALVCFRTIIWIWVTSKKGGE